LLTLQKFIRNIFLPLYYDYIVEEVKEVVLLVVQDGGYIHLKRDWLDEYCLGGPCVLCLLHTLGQQIR
jgi:hypothetical protein